MWRHPTASFISEIDFFDVGATARLKRRASSSSRLLLGISGTTKEDSGHAPSRSLGVGTDCAVVKGWMCTL